VLLVSVKSERSMIEWEAKRSEWCYFVLFERICKMCCSLITDLIVSKLKCCKCLWKVNDQWLDGKQNDSNDVTLFCWSAFARCSAPWSPIWLLLRSSVVSVCEKRTINDWMGSKVVRMILLCFVGAHLQDVLLLATGFYCY
jgi:hypothetical protein